MTSHCVIWPVVERFYCLIWQSVRRRFCCGYIFCSIAFLFILHAVTCACIVFNQNTTRSWLGCLQAGVYVVAISFVRSIACLIILHALTPALFSTQIEPEVGWLLAHKRFYCGYIFCSIACLIIIHTLTCACIVLIANTS